MAILVGAISTALVALGGSDFVLLADIVTDQGLLLGVPENRLACEGVGPFLKVVVYQEVDLSLRSGLALVSLTHLLDPFLQVVQPLFGVLVCFSLLSKVLLHLPALLGFESHQLLQLSLVMESSQSIA